MDDLYIGLALVALGFYGLFLILLNAINKIHKHLDKLEELTKGG